MTKSTLKSIWAVVAGVLFIILVTTLVDIVLHVVGVYPSDQVSLTTGQALIASSYRRVISIAGAYLTAKLAPQNPQKHALILGGVGTVLGAVGVVISQWMGAGPLWYAVSLAVLAVPQCWFGGWLFARRHGTTG
jgi:hypothetical protein